MRLNDELLERVEEFFDLIVVKDDSVELDQAIDSLRRFLEKDVDGWTSHSKGDLAYAVHSRLEDIWSLIPPADKSENFNIRDYYNDLMAWLENLLGADAAVNIQK